uniref:Uncharacterized protein n=1 Tax=Micrurus lemniscatus lemniscatus TaxID=129467 RepID=A0A2D4HVL5_MICLE
MSLHKFVSNTYKGMLLAKGRLQADEHDKTYQRKYASRGQQQNICFLNCQVIQEWPAESSTIENTFQYMYNEFTDNNHICKRFHKTIKRTFLTCWMQFIKACQITTCL